MNKCTEKENVIERIQPFLKKIMEHNKPNKHSSKIKHPKIGGKDGISEPLRRSWPHKYLVT